MNRMDISLMGKKTFGEHLANKSDVSIMASILNEIDGYAKSISEYIHNKKINDRMVNIRHGAKAIVSENRVYIIDDYDDDTRICRIFTKNYKEYDKKAVACIEIDGDYSGYHDLMLDKFTIYNTGLEFNSSSTVCEYRSMKTLKLIKIALKHAVQYFNNIGVGINE